MRRLGAVLAVAVVALAGCVRVTTDTTLGPDDTLSQHAIVAMTSEARTALNQQLGQLGGLDLPGDLDLPEGAADAVDLDALLDPDTVRAALAPLEERYPGSVSVEPYSDEDRQEGVEITVTDIPFDALADAAGTSPLSGGASVEREGDTYVVTLASEAATGLDSLGGAASQLSLLESAVDVEVSFTFPGLVSEATAGEVTGNTVVLGLSDLLASDTIRIVGGADPQRDWGPAVRWAVVGLAAAIVVGGAAALVMQDRRRRHRTHLPPPRPSAGTGGPGTLPADDGEPPRS